MKDQSKYILQIGAVQLVCLKVIDISPRQTPKIASFFTRKADGFDRGIVKDLPKAAETLSELFGEATSGSKEAIIPTRVVVSHDHLNNFIYGSSVYFYGNSHALTMKDVRDVIAQTRSVATIPLNEIIIQGVPQEFLVNDLTGISNPIGLEATRLGVSLRLFTMGYTIYSNLMKALERADIDAQEFIPISLAAAHAVLSPEEKEEGVILVDVGAYTTRLDCYKGSILTESKSISYGSEQITDMIASKLNVKTQIARHLKETFVYAQAKPQFGDELIPVTDKDEKKNHHVQRRKLEKEVEPIVSEIIEQLSDSIQEIAKQVAPITQVVFTGGGAKLDALLDVIQEKIPFSVRLGIPRNITNIPPVLADALYSGVVGAVDYTSLITDPGAYTSATDNPFARAVDSAKRWVTEYF